MGISQDPIGLAGGPALARYVGDPVVEYDPLGLSRRGDYGKAAKAGAGQSAKSAGYAFEDSVKATFRKKIITENEFLRDEAGTVIGEIDFETLEAIVEVGLSLGGKLPQLHRRAEVAASRGK